ncbi:hypothetical protein Aperf_G00000043373 [Anoplocephala perfoliata]
MSMPVSQELAKIFEAIDSDYNGYITRDELEQYARRTGQPASMVDDWFHWFDYGNTGRITYEDLCETLAIGMTKTYADKVEQKRELAREATIEPVKNKPRVQGGQQQGAQQFSSSRDNAISMEQAGRKRESTNEAGANVELGYNRGRVPEVLPSSSSALDGVKLLYSGSVQPGLMENVVEEIKSSNPDSFERESQFARYLKERMEKKWGQHWQVIVSKSTFGCSVGHEEGYFVHFQYGPYLYILYRTPE